MKDENSMRILVAGDFAPCASIEQAFLRGKRDFFDSKILDFLHNKDLSLVNLELPLTEADKPIPKDGPPLKARPAVVELIKQAGFDVACLSNNHIFDYNEQGLKDTLDVCKANDIATVGAGLTLHDARKVLYQSIKGQTIAIINFAENEFCNATTDRGGANPMDLVDNIHQIKEARANADVVMVIVHGGHEFYNYPSPRMVKQYRFYVENGADAVIAHHTHCVGPYEIYQGKPIVYSLGNFLFPSTTSFPGWYEGYCALLTFESDNHPTLKAVPFRQCDKKSLGVRSLNCDEMVQFESQLVKLSSDINEPNVLNARWDSFVSSMESSSVGRLAMLRRWPMGVLRRQPWLVRYLNKKRLRALLNSIQCEAHRDLSSAVLKRLLK